MPTACSGEDPSDPCTMYDDHFGLFGVYINDMRCNKHISLVVLRSFGSLSQLPQPSAAYVSGVSPQDLKTQSVWV